MFADAYETATDFTAPVVTAFHRPDGQCGSITGTMVFVNRDGWALTAWHIIKDIVAIDDQTRRNQKRLADAQVIEGDHAIDPREKKRRLREVGKPIRHESDAYMVLWGRPGLSVERYVALEQLDLAAIKLAGLTPDMVPVFPKIRSEATPLRNGMSVCKLGFPFHAVAPSYSVADNKFTFAEGSFPIPFFPIEGILTRIFDFTPPGSAFPLQLIETSTAGLKGQSGGPIIDQRGAICAIQSSTNVLDTGFDPEGPDGKKVRQFFSVGLGIHATTICGFFRDNGITYETATP